MGAGCHKKKRHSLSYFVNAEAEVKSLDLNKYAIIIRNKQ